jgi:antitoxin HicB
MKEAVMDIRYPAVLETQENGALLVRFVDLDDTFTEGATLDEALFNGAEVLSAMLGCRLDHDLPVPAPSPAGEGMYLIAPDARTQAALLIRQARGDRSLAELARSLETSWPSAQRLENPRHSPTLRQLERAAAALGKRLVLALE